MIEKIAVTNFKSHTFTEIELGRVTALVGPNACGKTSILQAAHHSIKFADTLDEGIFNAENHPKQIVRRGASSFNLSLSGHIEEERWEISVIYGPSNFGQNVYGTELTVKWQFGNQTYYRIKTLQGPESKQFLSSGPVEINRQMRLLNEGNFAKIIADAKTNYYKGIAKYLASASYSDSVTPEISPEGDGLASVLAFLILSDPARFEAINEALAIIAPAVKKIRARPAKVTRSEKKVFSVDNAQFPYEEKSEVVGHELIFDTISGSSLSAHTMSEGTLLVLGLLAFIYSPASPRLILLDDIEQGLHPLAQRRLINALKRFADEHDRQILLTTHSPYIVDELDAKDVWVMALDQEGVSHAKRLSDHPDIERGLSVLTTGEVWGAEGEDWVLNDPLPAETANA